MCSNPGKMPDSQNYFGSSLLFLSKLANCLQHISIRTYHFCKTINCMSLGFSSLPNKQKDRQKKARKEMASFLKKFNKFNNKIENAEEWYDSIKELEPILDNYKNDLPRDVYLKLKDSIELTDKTFKGIKAASKVLSVELKAANAILPAVGLPASTVISASIAVAVFATSLVIASSFVFAEIIITNNGCDDIPVLSQLVNLDERFEDITLFVDLPLEIAKNTSETIMIPPGNLEFDGEVAGQVIVKSEYMTIPFDIPNDVRSLEFDRLSLLEQQHSVQIEQDSNHELILNC